MYCFPYYRQQRRISVVSKLLYNIAQNIQVIVWPNLILEMCMFPSGPKCEKYNADNYSLIVYKYVITIRTQINHVILQQ